MRKILLASHGPLSGALKESASLIAGETATENVYSISIQMDTPKERVEDDLKEIFKDLNDGDEVLALTDVYGGSITRFVSEFVGQIEIHIITGVNLGMLLEALFASPEEPIEHLVGTLQERAIEGIRYINADLNTEKGGEEI
ncbi:MAG: hypothetical protein RR766_04475 [Longicatena sp.]